MMKQTITTFLFLLVGVYVFGQKDTSVLRSQSATECFEMAVKNKDYIIRINGVDYEDCEDVFICKDTPYNLQIRNNNIVMDSVAAESWDWTECECIEGNPQSFKATLILSKNKTMKVQFIVNEKKQNLKLDFKIIEKLEFDDKKTHKNKEYEFDENSIKKYPYYSNEHKWKFLAKNKTDKVFFKNESSTLFSQNIVNSIPIDNNNLEGFNGHLEISHLGSINVDSFNLALCDHVKPFLKVDVNGLKKIPVNIYALYESDDDKANYCINWDKDEIIGEFGQNGMSTDDIPGQRYKANCIDTIDSKDFECIDPGIDGSIDLYNRSSIWVDYTNDSITTKNYTAKVVADTDLKCSTLPRPNNVDSFSHNFNFIELEEKANEFYYKLGIELEFNYKGDKVVNYDGWKDDSKIDVDITSGSQENISYYRSIYPPGIFPDTTTIWIVPELFDTNNESSENINIIYGNSPFLKSKAIFLSAKYTTERTIAHELGHSNFGLVHPEGKLHHKNKLPEKISYDRYNFMNGGTLAKSYSEKFKDLRVRRYQWKLIFENI